MNDPSNWKISKAQKEELLALWAKLGWSEKDYGERSIDEYLWHEANSMISGATQVLENPKQWTIK